MRANEQQSLWYFWTRKLSASIEERTSFGPVCLGPEERKLRKFDCYHYSWCLHFAAKRAWVNFTCLGCRMAHKPEEGNLKETTT
jgi:hypothetical protein